MKLVILYFRVCIGSVEYEVTCFMLRFSLSESYGIYINFEKCEIGNFVF